MLGGPGPGYPALRPPPRRLRDPVNRAAIFVVVLGLFAAPLSADAQQPGKVYRIGYLSASNPSAASRSVEAFREGLRELGYVEGRNIAIEFRWAEGKMERLPELAGELINLKVDLILATATPGAGAAKRATSTIPSSW